MDNAREKKEKLKPLTHANDKEPSTRNGKTLLPIGKKEGWEFLAIRPRGGKKGWTVWSGRIHQG